MKCGTWLLMAFLAVSVASGCRSVEESKKAAFQPVDQMGVKTPWTKTDFRNDPAAFQFAIMSDRAGGGRPGIYPHAVGKLNLLQPEFVLCVGDLIEGHTDDEATLRQQRDELDGMVRKLEMPFFYVGGNHDFSNDLMAAYWERRFGRRFYSFVYKGVLFLCLDSQDLAGRGAGLSEEQATWAAKVIGDHTNVRWTFVFLHQPLWLYEEYAKEGQKGATRFGRVEQALDGRNYTVFAGHFHTYTKYVRHDRRYFVLATTGGDSSLAGPASGEFDHVTWVTLAPDGPKVAHLALDGILDENVVTESMVQAIGKLQAALQFKGVEIPEGANSAALQQKLVNPLDEPIEVRYAWDTAGTHWTMDPAAGTLKLDARGEATLAVTAAFDRQQPVPVPVFRGQVTTPSGLKVQTETQLRPLMRQNAAVVRVGAPPTVDGVIGAGEYGAAEFNNSFVDYRGRGTLAHQTRFLLAHDDKALYVAVVADEDEPGAITVASRQRDGVIWQDDSVELFIDTQFDRLTYYHFSTNTRSVQYDAIGGPDRGEFADPKWNGAWQTKTAVGPTQYVTEFAIPFETLGVAPPKPGEKWGFNVCRSRQAEGKRSGKVEMGAWSIPYANFHQPKHFGNVTFE